MGFAFRRGPTTYVRCRSILGRAYGRDIWRLFAGEEEGRVRSNGLSCIDLNLVMFCFDAATIGENRIAGGYTRLFRIKHNVITMRRLARDKPGYHQNIWLHVELRRNPDGATKNCRGLYAITWDGEQTKMIRTHNQKRLP
jgi:hypothetical protein